MKDGIQLSICSCFDHWNSRRLYWIDDKFDGLRRKLNFSTVHPIITYPEWANNHPEYYDKLTDGDEEEVSLFKTYKELMDVEFPDHSITESAAVGDSEWLICPDCMDAWNSPGDKDGMVICPNARR